jgi:hypothetical protein
MLRRWLRGDPLSRADGRHIHHQLRALGLTPRRALAVIYVETAAVAVLGLSATFAAPAMTVAIAVAGAAILLFIFVYGVRWLQYHEFLEAGTILASSGSRMRDAIRDTITARDLASSLRASRSFEHVNGLLESAAEAFRFAHMQLGPPMDRAPGHVLIIGGRDARVWKVEYPIMTADGHMIQDDDGRIVVLTIWCAITANANPASAERVAGILAPAIASWSETAGTSMLRRTAPRRVYSPVVSHRAIRARVLSEHALPSAPKRDPLRAH